MQPLLCVQGLTQTIPEMVPFRLTQNMVDAFGVSGYEGAFRSACEVTLQVSIPNHYNRVSVSLIDLSFTFTANVNQYIALRVQHLHWYHSGTDSHTWYKTVHLFEGVSDMLTQFGCSISCATGYAE